MTLPIADTSFVEATWILVVKSIVIFAVIFAIVPMLTVLERKLLGRFQARYGPNRVGPFGLLQPLADAVKLVSKEHYRPANAIPILWPIAPAIVVFTGVATMAILPFGDVKDGVGFYGIDVPIGILSFFAFGSIAFYGRRGLTDRRAASSISKGRPVVIWRCMPRIISVVSTPNRTKGGMSILVSVPSSPTTRTPAPGDPSGGGRCAVTHLH